MGTCLTSVLSICVAILHGIRSCSTTCRLHSIKCFRTHSLELHVDYITWVVFEVFWYCYDQSFPAWATFKDRKIDWHHEHLSYLGRFLDHFVGARVVHHFPSLCLGTTNLIGLYERLPCLFQTFVGMIDMTSISPFQAPFEQKTLKWGNVSDQHFPNFNASSSSSFFLNKAINMTSCP